MHYPKLGRRIRKSNMPTSISMSCDGFTISNLLPQKIPLSFSSALTLERIGIANNQELDTCYIVTLTLRISMTMDIQHESYPPK